MLDQLTIPAGAGRLEADAIRAQFETYSERAEPTLGIIVTGVRKP